MRSRNPRGDRSHRRPILESLESRELPSTLASAVAPVRHVPIRTSAAIARANATASLAGKPTAGLLPNPRIIRQSAALLYQPGTAPGTPTAGEIHRQTFLSRWVGQYTIGPPRFSDRAGTIHLYGTSGGSNQFLKGKFQIALFPPANPGAIPTPGNPYANQVTGVASLFGQNYLQSGAMLILDLNGTPAPGSPPDTLPTSLSWTYDANSSGGPYAAPGGIVPGSGFTRGTGMMQIQWIPDAHPVAGTQGSGRVVVTFQGLINTSQITSAVSKLIS